MKSYSPYILICKLHSNQKELFQSEIFRSQGIKKNTDFLLGRDILNLLSWSKTVGPNTKWLENVKLDLPR